jgi:hypothetical protein
MKERKRIVDLAEFSEVAIESLLAALSDGDEKHPLGSWMSENTGNQYNHLMAHLRALQNGIEKDDQGHDHLNHVICRAVIIAALRRRDRT